MITIKNAQKIFSLAPKVDKGKSVPKKTIVERNIEENVKLRRRRIAEIEEEEKNTKQWVVYLIKKVLNKFKKTIEKVPQDKKSMIEENEKIINIVENIFYFNKLEQEGEGLKILTPNQKHETLTENPPIQIYPNKIKNRIVFKIKTGYKLELLTPGAMKLLGSTKKDVDKDKDSENVAKLVSV